MVELPVTSMLNWREKRPSTVTPMARVRFCSRSLDLIVRVDSRNCSVIVKSLVWRL